MIKIVQKLDSPQQADTSLTLSIDQRIKSRLKVILDDGREAGLFLQRGMILRGGDYVQSQCGEVIVIQAANETVSTVCCNDDLLKCKAAYHLGNRHVPLQIESGFLRYQHDHVLDDMITSLGLEVVIEQAPFEPESGAYQGLTSAHSGHHH